MKRCAVACLVAGCAVAPTNPGSQEDADMRRWRELEGQLEKHRTEFLGPHVQDLNVIDNQLLWLDTTSFDPKLVRYDHSTDQRIAYTFSIGSGDLAN